MDIVSDLPKTTEPALIRREDYTPFPWLVPQVSLDFQLDLTDTRVVSRLSVEPNPAAEAVPVIRLNGDGLEAKGVKVDGQPCEVWEMDGSDLVIPLSAGQHEIVIENRINPTANTALDGLYASNGMLCTQCEAEGFRRITFFPDRPDVLSTYSVRMEGSKEQFPILLSNGDKVGEGDNADGTHWAEWQDPWPKPSYLFALVAGDLVVNRDSFTTLSGQEVELAIWVREGDLERTHHAMDSLKRSMRWDEEVFGREYDLGIFNIVAVSDFNMGAMENKSLNIFNTKYVLADTETATDADFDAVEGVIAHEYFHNWSGNRVTCRDWFQLSLKEGFTVLRDQLFSQDMGSAPVKRIEDVRVLRAAQFPEDSGPLAHPIRPDSYREISNFYTATVYNKGAEVIRMMRSMAGEEAFRKGCDLYFERHDGEAATCEDFVRAIEDGAGLDLTQFRLWYSQAGTPKVTISLNHSGDQVTLGATQTIPETPEQNDKSPMPIPLRIKLYPIDGGAPSDEQLIVIDESQASFTFDGFAEKPVLSVNRGYTAPVAIDREILDEELVFLASHDDDPFARYEALQELQTRHLVAVTTGALNNPQREAGQAAIGEAYHSIIADSALDDLMRSELMGMPAYSYVAEQLQVSNPSDIHEQREALKAWLGTELSEELLGLYERAASLPFGLDLAGKGARKVKAQVLGLIAASDPAKATELAAVQYDTADNMTDRQSALATLCGIEAPQRTEKLVDFHQRFAGNDLVVDKWFTLQAWSLHPDVVAQVKALAEHPEFTMSNPNRVRSLYMAFAGNPHGFHDAGGEGYRMIADLILALDPINPQTAARFVSPLGRWRRIEPLRSGMMKAELERIAKAEKLSCDTFEQVTRSLNA